MYAKVIKYILWVLLILSAAVGIYFYAQGFSDAAVDTLIYWTYGMVVLGLIASIVVGIIISAVNNPKSLLKLGAVALGAVAVVAIAYVAAKGTPAVGLIGPQPDAATLKNTDTILNLTYISCICSVVAIIVGAIVNAARK